MEIQSVLKIIEKCKNFAVLLICPILKKGHSISCATPPGSGWCFSFFYKCATPSGSVALIIRHRSFGFIILQRGACYQSGLLFISTNMQRL